MLRVGKFQYDLKLYFVPNHIDIPGVIITWGDYTSHIDWLIFMKFYEQCRGDRLTNSW